MYYPKQPISSFLGPNSSNSRYTQKKRAAYQYKTTGKIIALYLSQSPGF
jgi:hypothetical protein